MAPQGKASRKSPATGDVILNIFKANRKAVLGIVGLSAAANILALTGSIYMLQVYDRVLPSRSMPTLVGLTVLMIGLYAAFGVIDFLRGRVVQGLAVRLDRLMRGPVFTGVLQLRSHAGKGQDTTQPVRDLDQIRAFLSSQGPISLADMPWIPVYLTLVFLLHPLLGLLATLGAATLVALTWLTEMRSRDPAQASNVAAGERQSFLEATRRNSEIVRALGLDKRMMGRWQSHNEVLLSAQRDALHVTGLLGSAARVFRLVLQSALLGLGAYVVVKGEATGGVMIASSILASRALAPIEGAIANWRGFVGARQSYTRLAKVLGSLPQRPDPLALPRPVKKLAVEDISVAAPGERRPILHNISFTLLAGDGLGIIGPSASGKSTLARVLAGAWTAQRGSIRLDGAALDQWDREALGRDIGYLPQDIALFDGTIAENIARLDPNASAEDIIAAARAADVHEMVLSFPDGYATRIGEGGAVLSGGQRQRIALARALYGDPFFVVLDEPNANLDAEGDVALANAIAGVRARGGIVVVIAHRPSALVTIDTLAVLKGGRLQAFGPKEEVLSKVVRQVEPRQVDRDHIDRHHVDRNHIDRRPISPPHADPRQVEQRRIEQRHVERRRIDQRPADARRVESRQVETHSGETHQAETHQVHNAHRPETHRAETSRAETRLAGPAPFKTGAVETGRPPAGRAEPGYVEDRQLDDDAREGDPQRGQSGHRTVRHASHRYETARAAESGG